MTLLSTVIVVSLLTICGVSQYALDTVRKPSEDLTAGKKLPSHSVTEGGPHIGITDGEPGPWIPLSRQYASVVPAVTSSGVTISSTTENHNYALLHSTSHVNPETDRSWESDAKYDKRRGDKSSSQTDAIAANLDGSTYTPDKQVAAFTSTTTTSPSRMFMEDHGRNNSQELKIKVNHTYRGSQLQQRFLHDESHQNGSVSEPKNGSAFKLLEEKERLIDAVIDEGQLKFFSSKFHFPAGSNTFVATLTRNDSSDSVRGVSQKYESVMIEKSHSPLLPAPMINEDFGDGIQVNLSLPNPLPSAESSPRNSLVSSSPPVEDNRGNSAPHKRNGSPLSTPSPTLEANRGNGTSHRKNGSNLLAPSATLQPSAKNDSPKRKNGYTSPAPSPKPEADQERGTTRRKNGSSVEPATIRNNQSMGDKKMVNTESTPSSSGSYPTLEPVQLVLKQKSTMSPIGLEGMQSTFTDLSTSAAFPDPSSKAVDHGRAPSSAKSPRKDRQEHFFHHDEVRETGGSYGNLTLVPYSIVRAPSKSQEQPKEPPCPEGQRWASKRCRPVRNKND
ncbi:uncharacterized protein LOC124162023 [Ischnura elegans]|uniref:uncharacterized protein LOC124162023 n=1 Tax=Ischnura elegans TaxID=197161 RepID=UPI001ED8B775|nr:uncharacterized protein LOC124162023 [Ischnura elegans]